MSAGDLHEDPAKQPEMGWSEREQGRQDGPGWSVGTGMVRGGDLHEEPAKEGEMGRSEREGGSEEGLG